MSLTPIDKAAMTPAAAARSVARQLPTTLRLFRPLVLVVATAVAAVLVSRERMTSDVIDLLLAAGVAIGIAPALADAAANTLAPSPTSPLLRGAARLTIAVPAAVVAWFIARACCAPARLRWVPPRESWLVLAALLAIVLAAEATARNRGIASSALGPGLVVLFVLVCLRLPERWALLPVAENQGRWLTLLGGAVATLVLALGDPGRGRRRMTYSGSRGLSTSSR